MEKILLSLFYSLFSLFPRHRFITAGSFFHCLFIFFFFCGERETRKQFFFVPPMNPNYSLFISSDLFPFSPPLPSPFKITLFFFFFFKKTLQINADYYYENIISSKILLHLPCSSFSNLLFCLSFVTYLFV